MRPREGGFTLLEMLVALVVFGLVMAGIAQSFRFGLIAWSSATRHAAAPEQLAAMDAALSTMIAQTVPGSMSGRQDEIAFTTVLPPGAGLDGGLADAAILLQPDGTLVLRYAAHPPGIPLRHPPAPKTETLAQGVRALKFAYLAPPLTAGQPPAWSDTWLSGGQPLLVRVHLDFTYLPEWPDLVAATVRSGD